MANKTILPQLFSAQELKQKKPKKKYGPYPRPTTKVGRLEARIFRKGKRKWTDAQLVVAVRAARSMAHALRLLGVSDSGGWHYVSVQRRILELSLDTSHFLGQGWAVGQRPRNAAKKRPLSEILVEHSDFQTSGLRKKLVGEGILKNECSRCGISTWMGEAITLQIDHKNGVNDDHRLENIRLLCPNCHSQTPTFGSKNRSTVRARIAQLAEAQASNT